MSESLVELGISAKDYGKAEQRGPCPHCSTRSRDDCLGFNVETGVYHCFRCGWAGCVGAQTRKPAPLIAIDDIAVVERKRERLRRTWRESVPLTHVKAHAVRSYLSARGLAAVLAEPPKVLRAHPALDYWDGTRSLGKFPAMIALLHGAEGDAVTLHATYLRSDGCAKASVPSPKKILGVPTRGATKGGAIHLHEPRAGVLGVAEGIESALSLHLIRGVPVWAAFCADNLERVRLPQHLRELHIAIDIDSSGKGKQVAEALAARALKWKRRIRVYLIEPEIEGPGDLNDELRRRAQ